MYKLNFLQYPEVKDVNIKSNYSNQALKSNFEIDKLIRNYKNKFAFDELKTMSFTKESLLGFLFTLKGKIAVSVGESEALIQAAKIYKDLGNELDFISLKKDGTLEYEDIKKDIDYIFCSSYVMDTYVKIDLKKVKDIAANCTIISNISATLDASNADIAILDAYKLTGFSTSCVILHNDLNDTQALGEIDTISLKNIYDSFFDVPKYANKAYFIKCLKNEFNDDFFFFVDPNDTLDNALHFGMKNIKAREIIRTLSLGNIFVTNGEGCSLGLSRPSRILQEMQYSELESRQALSLSFKYDYENEDLEKIAKKIAKAYRQIKALHD